MGDKVIDDYSVVKGIISRNQFHVLDRKGLINRTRLRNIKIKREFIMLRSRMKPMEAVEYLSRKYFRSDLTITFYCVQKEKKIKSESKVRGQKSEGQDGIEVKVKSQITVKINN